MEGAIMVNNGKKRKIYGSCTERNNYSVSVVKRASRDALTGTVHVTRGSNAGVFSVLHAVGMSNLSYLLEYPVVGIAFCPWLWLCLVAMDVRVNWPKLFGRDKWCVTQWGWIRIKKSLFKLIDHSWFPYDFPEFDGLLDVGNLDDISFCSFLWDARVGNIFTIFEGVEEDLDDFSFVDNMFECDFSSLLGVSDSPPQTSKINLEIIDDDDVEVHCAKHIPYTAPLASDVATDNVKVDPDSEDDVPLIIRRNRLTPSASKPQISSQTKPTKRKLEPPTPCSPPLHAEPKSQPTSSQTKSKKRKLSVSSSDSLKTREVLIESFVSMQIIGWFGQTGILDVLEHQGWSGIFVRDETFLDQELVREFYVNCVVREHELHSKVQGRSVVLSVARIGEILGIPCVGYDRYLVSTTLTSNEKRDYLRLARIYEQNHALTFTDIDTHMVRKLKMNPLANFTFWFVVRNVLPRKERRSNASYRDIQLVDHLVKNMPINLPALMFKHISNIISLSRDNCLAYGSLLSILLQKSGVHVGDVGQCKFISERTFVQCGFSRSVPKPSPSKPSSPKSKPSISRPSLSKPPSSKPSPHTTTSPSSSPTQTSTPSFPSQTPKPPRPQKSPTGSSDGALAQQVQELLSSNRALLRKIDDMEDKIEVLEEQLRQQARELRVDRSMHSQTHIELKKMIEHAMFAASQTDPRAPEPKPLRTKPPR